MGWLGSRELEAARMLATRIEVEKRKPLGPCPAWHPLTAVKGDWVPSHRLGYCKGRIHIGLKRTDPKSEIARLA